MRCDEFEIRLNELLDRRERPELDAPLCAHARECDACGETLFAHELLFEGLVGQSRPQPPADLSERVLASWRMDSRAVAPDRKGLPSFKRWTSAIGAVSVAAAAVVFAIGVSVYWNGSLPPQTELRNDTVAKVERAPTTPPVPTMYTLVFEDPEYLERMKESLSSDVPVWVGGVTSGLRPVADSMEAAIDALRSSVPNFLIAG